MTHRALRREPLDTTVEIDTPEHVRFRYQVAGPAKRAVAYLVDLAVRGTVVFTIALISTLAGLSAGDAVGHASNGLLLLVFFVVDWSYYVFFETIWSGRTPGKRVLSLRVVTEGGHPLRFTDSVLRNHARAADMLPFGYAVGLVVMGNDARFRRLGDLAAGTLVVTEERGLVAGPLRIDPPPSVAELRPLPQRLPLSGDELDAVELFLRRVGKLSVLREHELAEMVAPIFARRLGVRYRDASRLLSVLHHRAHEHHGARAISSGETPKPRQRSKRGVPA